MVYEVLFFREFKSRGMFFCHTFPSIHEYLMHQFVCKEAYNVQEKRALFDGGVILYTHPDVACGKIEQGSRFLLLAEFTTVIWLPYPLVQWYCILLLDIPVNPSSKRFNSRLCCFYERWLSLALACLSKCSRGDVIIRIPQRESGKGSTGFPIGTCIYMIY